MVTVSIGFIGGQFAVNLWAAGGYESFILASVMISAAILPLLLSPIAGPAITLTRRIPPATLRQGFPPRILNGLSTRHGVWRAHMAHSGISDGNSAIPLR